MTEEIIGRVGYVPGRKHVIMLADDRDALLAHLRSLQAEREEAPTLVRFMDGLDAYQWAERQCLDAAEKDDGPHKHLRNLSFNEEDGGVLVYSFEDRPRAVAVVLRDTHNFSVAFRMFPRRESSEARAEAAESKLSLLEAERDEQARFAQGWHSAVEIMLTVAGLSSALGAAEACEAMRDKLSLLEARLRASEKVCEALELARCYIRALPIPTRGAAGILMKMAAAEKGEPDPLPDFDPALALAERDALEKGK